MRLHQSYLLNAATRYDRANQTWEAIPTTSYSTRALLLPKLLKTANNSNEINSKWFCMFIENIVLQGNEINEGIYWRM